MNRTNNHRPNYGILYGIAAYGARPSGPVVVRHAGRAGPSAGPGYFINPLLSVLLGVVFLRERLRPAQTLSIALAAAGVLILTRGGQFPWIAVALALAYLGYLGAAAATPGSAPAAPLLLLMLAGPVTTVPLLFFGAAARRLRLSTLGILQYLAPSLQFLLAVAAFHEPFSLEQLLSFACIWTAIAIYATDSFRAAREGRIEVVEPD